MAKYAQAEAASVDLSVEDDRLRVEIRDDGVGGADPAGGTGLRGLRDRVDALDGRLEVHSPPGGGTTVAVELPVRAPLARARCSPTAWTGGRRVATSNQLAPASPEPKTAPDVAPK